VYFVPSELTAIVFTNIIDFYKEIQSVFRLGPVFKTVFGKASPYIGLRGKRHFWFEFLAGPIST
jgi:hypothetical protein